MVTKDKALLYTRSLLGVIYEDDIEWTNKDLETAIDMINEALQLANEIDS